MRVGRRARAPGHVVCGLRDGSPLAGELLAGDQIVLVDDVETRAFAYEQLVALIVERTAQPRALTVLRDATAARRVPAAEPKPSPRPPTRRRRRRRPRRKKEEATPESSTERPSPTEAEIAAEVPSPERAVR